MHLDMVNKINEYRCLQYLITCSRNSENTASKKMVGPLWSLRAKLWSTGWKSVHRMGPLHAWDEHFDMGHVALGM